MHRRALIPVVVCVLCGAPSGAGWSADPAAELVARLAAWEAASAEKSVVRPDVAFADIEEQYTAHELQTAADFCGPVEAARLIQEFSWSERVSRIDRVVLRAEPRDALTRLFYSAVDIEFDRATWSVRTVQFHDGEGRPRPRAIVAPAVPSNGGGVVTAASAEPASSEIRLVARFVEPAELLESPIADDVQEVLDQWSEAMRDIRAVDGTFRRYTYDSVFHTERRAVGRFHFEAPNRGLYVVEPVNNGRGSVSQKRDSQGRPYTVIADESVTYYWNGTHVVWIDDEMVPIPESLDSEIRTVGSWDLVWARMAAPQRVLPGAVDVHNEDFLSRYHWSILRKGPRQIMLQGYPVTQESRYHLSQLQVILDPETFLTTATRLVDAGASREVVHVFEYGTIDRSIQPAKRDWEPDLSRYRQSKPLRQAPPVSAAE